MRPPESRFLNFQRPQRPNFSMACFACAIGNPPGFSSIYGHNHITLVSSTSLPVKGPLQFSYLAKQTSRRASIVPSRSSSPRSLGFSQTVVCMLRPLSFHAPSLMGSIPHSQLDRRRPSFPECVVFPLLVGGSLYLPIFFVLKDLLRLIETLHPCRAFDRRA